jgi:LysM repeat protein
MQHDNSDDPFGFWNDEPTRQLKRPQAGTRSHAETRSLPVTRMVPVVRTDRTRPIAMEPRPRNPVLIRTALVVGVMSVLVPLGLSMRSDEPLVRAADIQGLEPDALVGNLPAPAPTIAPDTVAATTTTLLATPVPSVVPAATEAVVVTAAPTDPPTTPAPAKKAAPKTTTTQAPAPTAAQAADQACPSTYTIVSGDSWSGIASRAHITMKALLAVNNATTSTLLLPGKDICLPAGAAEPGPPSAKPPATTAPATTQPKPSTTQPKPTTPPATSPPATSPPATQPAPPANTYTRAEVAQIIRDVWPDSLEEEAIRIATRESNLIPTVRNACCYGLFQIYYTAHKTWLASIGVTSAAQLYDPRVNASAALALYNISGWAPWGTPAPTTTVAATP